MVLTRTNRSLTLPLDQVILICFSQSHEQEVKDQAKSCQLEFISSILVCKMSTLHSIYTLMCPYVINDVVDLSILLGWTSACVTLFCPVVGTLCTYTADRVPPEDYE